MNKKNKILIIIGIIAILITIGIITTLSLTKSKNKPEEIWQQYVSYINEQKYEEMYKMLTEESKSQIT